MVCKVSPETFLPLLRIVLGVGRRFLRFRVLGIDTQVLGYEILGFMFTLRLSLSAILRLCSSTSVLKSICGLEFRLQWAPSLSLR